MGIRIDGASDQISAADGSLTIEGQSINSTGIGTFSGGVKVGSAATIHSTGQFNIGVAATIFASGNATFAGILTASNTTISSRLLIGNDSVRSIAGHSPRLQIQGTEYNSQTFGIISNSADANPAYFQMSKQRSGSVGGSTIVQDGDGIGHLVFTAGDGTDADSRVAEVKVQIDGTPGSNDTPGRILFMTTADGAQSTTERIRVYSDGCVGIGTMGADSRKDGHLQVETETTGRYAASFANHHASGSKGVRIQACDSDESNWILLAENRDGTNRFGVQGTGDVTVHDGNLVIGTAGHGIDFSAQTQSTSTTDDEILDHYEKGKWTPVVKKNDVANASADIIHGRYIRIGKLCWLSMYARWNSGSNAQGTSGGWTIHGLPFSLQDDNPGTCRIYQSAPAGYMSIDGTNYAYGDNPRWQINTSTYFDLYTDTSSADQAWTTGQMIVHFTGAFMIHE